MWLVVYCQRAKTNVSKCNTGARGTHTCLDGRVELHVKTMTERQRYILDRLEKQGTVAISDLKAQLGVSSMTVHRDIDRLATAGLLRKLRGEVSLPDRSITPPGRAGSCALCGGALSDHNMVLVSDDTGERRQACCAHCGLRLLQRSLPGTTALTVDFITHRIVDARQAVYVVESGVTLCCSPGILAFSSPEAAEGFRRGFGGARIDFDQALAYVQGARPAP
jgi:DeoR family transcriptional regulator, copper-sensing transcriptional repressor